MQCKPKIIVSSQWECCLNNWPRVVCSWMIYSCVVCKWSPLIFIVTCEICVITTILQMRKLRLWRLIIICPRAQSSKCRSSVWIQVPLTAKPLLVLLRNINTQSWIWRLREPVGILFQVFFIPFILKGDKVINCFIALFFTYHFVDFSPKPLILILLLVTSNST